MAEIIDEVFTKTSPNLSFSIIENERFGLVFVKTGSINSGRIRIFMYVTRSEFFLLICGFLGRMGTATKHSITQRLCHLT